MYLKGTIELELTLGGDNLSVVKWWVDASYACHNDMKGHTGATMSFGRGAVTSASKKQKINTTSTTESELVGVLGMSPQMMWTQYFLENQGYEVGTSMLYQDNKSAILLEQNGRKSSSKRTKHINVRYFFIKDKVESGEITVEYCSTHDMLGDYFTKPLKGKKFIEFRDRIMGVIDAIAPAPAILRRDGSNAKCKQSAGVCWASNNQYAPLAEQ